MRNRLRVLAMIAVLVLFMGLIDSGTYASEQFEGQIVNVPVYINKVQIDQSQMSHPLVIADNTIYVPISTGFMYAVGLTIDFYTGSSGEDELWLERLYVNSLYDLYPAENMPVSGAVTLTPSNNKVYIELHRIATELDDLSPAIYNHITYIPLTDTAIRAFKWDVNYNEEALHIEVPAYDYRLEDLSVASQFLEFFEDLVYFDELGQYWDQRVSMQRQQQFESYYQSLIEDNAEQVGVLLNRAVQLEGEIEGMLPEMQAKSAYEQTITDKTTEFNLKKTVLLSKTMKTIEGVKTYGTFNAQGKPEGETLRVGDNGWEVGLMEAGYKTGEWFTQQDDLIYITNFTRFQGEIGPLYYKKGSAVYYYSAVANGYPAGLVEMYYADGRRSRAEYNALGERSGIEYVYDANDKLVDFSLYEDHNGQPLLRVYRQTLEDGTVINGFEGQDETGYPLRVWYPISGKMAEEGITHIVYNDNYSKDHSIKTQYFLQKPPVMEIETEGARMYLSELAVGTFVLEDMYSGGQGYVHYPDGIIYSGIIDYELPTGQGTYYFDGGKEMTFMDSVLAEIITPEMSRYEKMEAAYDWIIKQVDPEEAFAIDALVASNQAHLGILEGRTSYFGYQELFAHLMYKMGYTAEFKHGKLEHELMESYGSLYVWTTMKIDGKSYDFDPFLDDALNHTGDRKAFFYLDASDMALTHVPLAGQE